jgi:NAD(P)-dependent dehydrogenase (short-subunit alcohol dehydrogenase family)
VTGAGGGIGALVCKRFAEEGCSIVAADVKADVLQKLAEEVALSGVGALEPVTADISTDEGNAQLVEVATAHFGGLDVFHGGRSLCRSLATSLGPDDIRVATICPGDGLLARID